MITEFIISWAIVGVYRNFEKTTGDYELKIGYKSMLGLKKPLIVDMRKTPHLFISGLSGNGKTKMVEYAVRDKKCILINVFEEDFKSIAAERIIGNSNILKYLNTLIATMTTRSNTSKPLYIVIDELLVLCGDKSITKAISDLLAVARHYNIFLIGICQIGAKEGVKFKDLFNSRVSFRQVEESSYRVVLGYSPEHRQLRKREFYLYSDKIERGYTYTI